MAEPSLDALEMVAMCNFRSVRTLRKSRMTPELINLVSFRRCEHLCRATGLDQMMRNGAALFRNSDGSAATFAYSKEVKVINFFVSHNWVVSRFRKFVTLAVHFNHSAAAVVTAVYSVLLGVLLYLNKLPVSKNGAGDVTGVWGQVTCMPVYLLTLFTFRDAMWLCGHRGQTGFLDKVCIHQVDEDLKRQGIVKLGAYLQKSQQMIVIYSDVYLRKLWTVYEIAAFLTLHPIDDLIVLPVRKQMHFLITVMVGYLYQLLCLVAWSLLGDLGSFAFSLLGLLPALAYTVDARWWARHKCDMLHDVGNFTVRNCTCFNEDDRPIVHHNILLLLKGCGEVLVDATEDEALERFDVLVRSQVLDRFFDCIGRSSFTYSQYVCVGFTMSGGVFVDQLAKAPNGIDELVVVAELVAAAGWVVGGWILICRYLEFVAQTRLHLRGWRELAWIAFLGFFCIGLPCGVAGVLAVQLTRFASASVVGVVVQVVVWALLSGLAWWLSHLDVRASLRASASAAADGDEGCQLERFLSATRSTRAVPFA